VQRLYYALDPSSGLGRLTITTDAMINAAEFWAFLRQTVIPTASPDALDADPILAGQAGRSLGSDPAKPFDLLHSLCSPDLVAVTFRLRG